MASIRKRYDLRYRTPDGSACEEAFRTRREADQRLHSIEVEKARGGWLDPRRAARPFGEVVEERFSATLRSIHRRGRVTVRSSTSTSSRPRGSSVGSVTPKTVQGLVSEWCKRMRPRSAKGHFSERLLRRSQRRRAASLQSGRSPRESAQGRTIARTRCTRLRDHHGSRSSVPPMSALGRGLLGARGATVRATAFGGYSRPLCCAWRSASSSTRRTASTSKGCSRSVSGSHWLRGVAK